MSNENENPRAGSAERRIAWMAANPTNPEYTDAPHPDPRVHGTERCKHRCEVCRDGLHHWLESGFDPDEPYFGSEDDPDREQHAAIKATGAENAAAHYVCKHCSTWAECEYVWELEDGDPDGTEDLE